MNTETQAMNLTALIDLLTNNPDQVEFTDVLSVIDSLYDYRPARFSNGLGEDKVVNDAGTNEGSCRVLAFAMDQGLTKEQTLNCFAQYYRDDVLNNPEGSDHANIRNFMRYGWDGIVFDSVPLNRK